jgi:hypothetical protein
MVNRWTHERAQVTIVTGGEGLIQQLRCGPPVQAGAVMIQGGKKGKSRQQRMPNRNTEGEARNSAHLDGKRKKRRSSFFQRGCGE